MSWTYFQIVHAKKVHHICKFYTYLKLFPRKKYLRLWLIFFFNLSPETMVEWVSTTDRQDWLCCLEYSWSNNQTNSKNDIHNLIYHFMEFEGVLATTVSSSRYLLLTLMHFSSPPSGSTTCVVDTSSCLHSIHHSFFFSNKISLSLRQRDWFT